MNTIQNFIDAGFVLFPLAPMSKQPPLGTSGHLAYEAEDTLDCLDELTDGVHNVAIQTGARSKIVVVDVDPRNEGSRQAVVQLFGREIATREHATANGGLHLFFRYPAHVEHIPSVPGKLGKGIDVKADGGYVVAPPSKLSTGSYTVINDSELEDLPEHILKLLVPEKRERVEQHYQYSAAHYDSVLRWHEMNVQDANNAADGERDNTVYSMMVRSMQLAFTVPDDVLSVQKVQEDFRAGVKYRIKGFGGKSERSAAFAESNPRPWPEFTRPVEIKQSQEDYLNVNDYVPDADRLATQKLNDLGNADRVAEMLKDRVRYVLGEGWFIWNGKCWNRESTDGESIVEIVSNCNKKLWMDLKQAEEKFGLSKTRERFVHYCNNMNGIRATISKLQSTARLRVDVSQMDARPNLLTCANGTVDLRTGMLMPHDPRHLITMMINVEYDPSARAERFEKFLVEVMPDHPELVSFLQRLIGYGITGEISEHAMAIHYGRGRNGKSVFFDAVRNVFGDISSVADWKTFALTTNGSGGGARGDIARLRGKRLVTVNEGDARTRMDEAQIKKMVSGDTISARALYQDDMEYRPSFLLQMATNAKPDFRGADEGLWNRVKLIPWTRYFEPHERDKTLTETLFAEAQGILTWGVRGAVEWYASGLREPESIREATQDYRDSSDELSGFIGDVEHGAWLVGDNEGSLPSAWTLALYKTWAEQQNYDSRDMLDARKLKAAMEERGYSAKKTMHGNVYLGLSANVTIQAVAQAAATVSGKSRPSRLDTPKGDGQVTQMF